VPAVLQPTVRRLNGLLEQLVAKQQHATPARPTPARRAPKKARATASGRSTKRTARAKKTNKQPVTRKPAPGPG
jgi:hypothetical protein